MSTKRGIAFQATITEMEVKVSEVSRRKYLKLKLSTGNTAVLSSNDITDHLVAGYFIKLRAQKPRDFEEQVARLKSWHIPLFWRLRIEVEYEETEYPSVRLEGCLYRDMRTAGWGHGEGGTNEH